MPRTVGVEVSLFFLPAVGRFTAPLGDRPRSLELDGMPRGWQQRRVAADGDTLLRVPTTNQWPSAVSVIAVASEFDVVVTALKQS